MVRTCRPSTAQNKHPTSRQIRKEKHRKASICLLGAVSGIATAVAHIAPFLDKKPMHTSILMGQGWVDELLNGIYFLDTFPMTGINYNFTIWLDLLLGHPLRFRRAMGMHRHVFCKLVRELETRTWLCPTRWVSSEEQLAIFLRIARTGQGNAEMQERFQRSGDTVSK